MQATRGGGPVASDQDNPIDRERSEICHDSMFFKRQPLCRRPARRVAAALCAAAVLAMMGTPAGAETFAQRQACKPDVFRLCSQFILDREAITQYLAA